MLFLSTVEEMAIMLIKNTMTFMLWAQSRSHMDGSIDKIILQHWPDLRIYQIKWLWSYMKMKDEELKFVELWQKKGSATHIC